MRWVTVRLNRRTCATISAVMSLTLVRDFDLASHFRGSLGSGHKLLLPPRPPEQFEWQQYEVDARHDDIAPRAIHRVPHRGPDGDDENKRHQPSKRSSVFCRGTQPFAVVDDGLRQPRVAYPLTASGGADSGHAVLAGKLLGARPITRHPARHHDAVDQAGDHDRDDAAEPDSGINPCQGAEAEAHRKSKSHPPVQRTAPPYLCRHRDHTAIVPPARRIVGLRAEISPAVTGRPLPQTVKPSARSCSRPSSVILSGPHGGFHTQLILISLTSPAPTRAERDWSSITSVSGHAADV